jgi:hypothetical protein
MSPHISSRIFKKNTAFGEKGKGGGLKRTWQDHVTPFIR